MDKNALKELVVQTAKKYGIPEDVALKQIGLEQNFNPNAVSSAGAIGIAQFKPATAKAYGLTEDQLTDPVASMEAYGKHMKELLTKYGGDIGKALLAYNQGEGKKGSPQLQAYDNGEFNKIGEEGRNYLNKIGFGQDSKQEANPQTQGSPSALPPQNGQPSLPTVEPAKDMFEMAQIESEKENEDLVDEEEGVDESGAFYKIGKGLFDNDVVKGVASGIGEAKKAVYDPIRDKIKEGTDALSKEADDLKNGIQSGIDEFMVGAGMKTKDDIIKERKEAKSGNKGFSFLDGLQATADLMAGDTFENIAGAPEYQRPEDNPYMKNYLKQPRKRF